MLIREAIKIYFSCPVIIYCYRLSILTNVCSKVDSSSSITLRTVKTYLSHGQELAIEMQNRAKWLYDKGCFPKLHTPAMLHLINNLGTENTVGINYESELCLFGAKMLQRSLFSEYVNSIVIGLIIHSNRPILEILHDYPL